MKKKLISIVSIVLVLALVVGCVAAFAGCDEKPQNNGGDSGETAPVVLKELTKAVVSSIEVAQGEGKALSEIKIGLICLHGKNSTYDKNFIDAMESLQANLGLADSQVFIKEGIPEGVECYETACDLVDRNGCNLIFADSFGHEDYMIQAAKKYPNVQFCHATGTKAHTENLANYHNAFASIYEGRYLAGVAAGLKLKEMIDNGTQINGKTVSTTNCKVGYIGAFTYAEVISGYTSWFLGVRSIVPQATMEVTFTGSWYDETAENTAAKTLIANGCVLISQHADSMGAPNACEEKGVPNVSYNGSTATACPNTFIVSSRINWEPYYKYCVDCLLNGKAIAKDFVGTIATGSVQLTELGTAAAAGTAEKLAEVKQQLEEGTLNVFDTDNFTVALTGSVVGSAKLARVGADVDTDAAYAKDTNVIIDGVYCESYGRSAPYFDITIEGITLLDTAF